MGPYIFTYVYCKFKEECPPPPRGNLMNIILNNIKKNYFRWFFSKILKTNEKIINIHLSNSK
jgi:hypothetical protein